MNVLSIDGGGIRGIIPAMILNRVEELTKTPVSKLFQLITGTSTGGIIALGLSLDDGNGAPKFKASDLVNLYKNRGKDIFERSIWHRIRSVGNAADEKYSNNNLIEILTEAFGEATLKDTLTEVIIPSYETERRIPWIFKSMHAKNPEKKGYNFKLVDVALATSAAPTYFEPYKVPYLEDDHLSFIDGGVYANNPAMCAYVEARSLFDKNKGEINLVSLGTGQLTRELYHKVIKDWGLISWAQPVISCVFDGVSDTVGYQLSKILTDKHYFRFQSELRTGNDDMDDASKTNIRALQLLAEEIIQNNKQQIDKMVRVLTADLEKNT